MKKSWSVAVLFEDNATRKEAQDFFERLAADYWSETEFKLEWASFEALADDFGFREQARKFARADFLIFANCPHRPLPFHVHQWGEEWLRLRGRREGVLVAVSEPARASVESANTYAFLRQLAHRAGMDYMTDMPPNLEETIPNGPEQCRDRAEQMTSTLNTIMRHAHTRVAP
jgi:hypothetical protein